MSSFAEIANQYFWKAYKQRIEPEQFIEAEKLCNEIGVAPRFFLDAVFAPRYSEQLTKHIIRPKHLSSTWALEKLRDYTKLHASNNVNPFTMEAEYIRRTKQYISALGIPEQEYYSGGVLMPPVLKDIAKRKVSVLYVATNSCFQTYYKRMPNDIKEEYLQGIDILYLSKCVKLSNFLREVCNE